MGVNGTNIASDFSSGYISSLSTAGPAGASLSMFIITANGVVINGESSVTIEDNKAINGVVHIADALFGLPHVVNHALANPNLSSLAGTWTANGHTTYTNLYIGGRNRFYRFRTLEFRFRKFYRSF